MMDYIHVGGVLIESCTFTISKTQKSANNLQWDGFIRNQTRTIPTSYTFLIIPEKLS